MFDTSFLAEADHSFVVLSDTHCMRVPKGAQLEFQSRRQQSERAAYAYSLIKALHPDMIVHLGDLVQEFPESPGFAHAMTEALMQISEAGLQMFHVAGNHDVGDKPDLTMPTAWVNAESLAGFESRFDCSWYSWDAMGFHFIVLNSQIMNGPLPQARMQRDWLESDLRAKGGVPTIIFLHLAPFLVDPAEEGDGHYDNIGEPDRSWLLRLIERFNIKAVFFGHSHFAFFNRIGQARLFLTPSTAFTRPGFAELFSSAPPPERGRSDTEKLGFFLIRLVDEHVRVHFIRTQGWLAVSDEGAQSRRILAGVSRDLTSSPIGMTLLHPLTNWSDGPIAWPSSVRQQIRNDYPFLALLELGVQHIRVPASDMRSGLQRERIRLLRDEGVQITLFWLWGDQSPVVDEVQEWRRDFDVVELQVPVTIVPSGSLSETIRELRRVRPVSLTPVFPNQMIPGKQHMRTRVGYDTRGLLELAKESEDLSQVADRFTLHVPVDATVAQTIAELRTEGMSDLLGSIDFLVCLGDLVQGEQTARAVEAIVSSYQLKRHRIFLEPFQDFDRSMDVSSGFLDRLCNPRPAFHALKTLNTILYGRGETWTPVNSKNSGTHVFERDEEAIEIFLTSSSTDVWFQRQDTKHRIDLGRGRIEAR